MNPGLLFKLLRIPSPSGHEERIKAFIAERLSGLGIAITDLGRAGLAWKIGESEKECFFLTHIDQVCMVVRHIDDEGYVYVEMPGIDPRVMISQEVIIWGKEPLPGVVGMIPPHYLSEEEQSRPIPSDKVFIDLGLDAQKARELVSPGDTCNWSPETAELLGSRVTGSGLDNKISVFLALVLAEELKDKNLPGCIRFFATTQEETGMFGAGFAGKSENPPSFAIIADATFGTSAQTMDKAFPLGKGPALGVGPVLSKKHTAFIRKIADELSLSYSLEPLVRGTGTEADVLSLAGKGIPTNLVSLPIRSMHTPVEVADLADVETACDILSAALVKEELWDL